MVQIQKFVFSPFSENTYVVYDASGKCWVIDPGCYEQEEERELSEFIERQKLTPVRLLNTHCHLDHVFGNAFIHENYGLFPEYHSKDEPTMGMAELSAKIYGIQGFKPSPTAKNYLSEGEVLALGESEWETVFVPGHAPGHIAFINHIMKTVIGGDVLFYRSIGRTDLPGGHHQTLISSIQEKFMTLPDDFIIYSGHGPETTIGEERKHNPFL